MRRHRRETRVLTRANLRACKLLLVLAAGLTTAPVSAAFVVQPDKGCPVTSPDKAETIQAEVFYKVFVRSFYDSDGDRIGDLNGVTEKLDYIEELGATSVLLTPVYSSRFYHNYFANDFGAIDAEYGDWEDFAALIDAVHARGMKIYLDNEVQFVSQHHPWFINSYRKPTSPEADYMLYKDKAHTEPRIGIMDSMDLKAWPDMDIRDHMVNLLNADVQAYFETYFTKLMDPNGDGDFSDGVDGFRADHVLDDDQGVLTGLLDDFWAPLFSRLKARNPDIHILAEPADWGDGADILSKRAADYVYAFPIWWAAQLLDGAKLRDELEQLSAAAPDGSGHVVFMENFDTDRFASFAGNSPQILRIAADVMLLSGWTPQIYYGQELGVAGKRVDTYHSDADDIPVRLAFPWNKDRNTEGIATWYLEYPESYWTPPANVPGDGVSVEEQAGDPASLLSYYKALIRLRSAHPALACGSTRVVPSGSGAIALERTFPGQQAVVIFNFSDTPAHVNIAVAKAPDSPLRHIFGASSLRVDNGTLRGRLGAYESSVWILP